MRPPECAAEIVARTRRVRLPENPVARGMMTSHEVLVLEYLLRRPGTMEERLAAVSRLLIEVDAGGNMNKDQCQHLLSELMQVALADDDPRVRSFTARFLPHVISGVGRGADPRSRSWALALSREFTAAADASQDRYLRDQARACAELLATPR
jgi:hypothetical protein